MITREANQAVRPTTTDPPGPISHLKAVKTLGSYITDDNATRRVSETATPDPTKFHASFLKYYPKSTSQLQKPPVIMENGQILRQGSTPTIEKTGHTTGPCASSNGTANDTKNIPARFAEEAWRKNIMNNDKKEKEPQPVSSSVGEEELDSDDSSEPPADINSVGSSVGGGKVGTVNENEVHDPRLRQPSTPRSIYSSTTVGNIMNISSVPETPPSTATGFGLVSFTSFDHTPLAKKAEGAGGAEANDETVKTPGPDRPEEEASKANTFDTPSGGNGGGERHSLRSRRQRRVFDPSDVADSSTNNTNNTDSQSGNTTVESGVQSSKRITRGLINTAAKTPNTSATNADASPTTTNSAKCRIIRCLSCDGYIRNKLKFRTCGGDGCGMYYHVNCVQLTPASEAFGGLPPPPNKISWTCKHPDCLHINEDFDSFEVLMKQRQEEARREAQASRAMAQQQNRSSSLKVEAKKASAAAAAAQSIDLPAAKVILKPYRRSDSQPLSSRSLGHAGSMSLGSDGLDGYKKLEQSRRPSPYVKLWKEKPQPQQKLTSPASASVSEVAKDLYLSESEKSSNSNDNGAEEEEDDEEEMEEDDGISTYLPLPSSAYMYYSSDTDEFQYDIEKDNESNDDDKKTEVSTNKTTDSGVGSGIGIIVETKAKPKSKTKAKPKSKTTKAKPKSKKTKATKTGNRSLSLGGNNMADADAPPHGSIQKKMTNMVSPRPLDLGSSSSSVKEGALVPYNSGLNESITPMEPPAPSVPVVNWTKEDVRAYFVQKGLPKIGDTFFTQEIDGQALLLCRRMDITQGMGFLLGPALKAYRVVLELQLNRYGGDDLDFITARGFEGGLGLPLPLPPPQGNVVNVGPGPA